MKRLVLVLAILVLEIFFPAPKMVSATVKDSGVIAYCSYTGKYSYNYPSWSQAGRDNYGVIAYCSSTRKYGYTYNYPSRSQAERDAIIHCQDVGGTDCRSIVWFKNNCGAIARAGKRVYWAYGDTRAQAETSVMNECYNNETGCRFIVSVCNSR